VGSKGSKPRKPSHSQHLAKVGTKTENERLQRAERHAVADNVGISGMSSGLSVVLTLILAALFVLAIWALIRL
jgi:hypothetical protein